jgi:peptidoglycan/LPS O-acetylase OafA/YrhL
MIVAGPPIDGATDWYNVYRSVDTSPHAIIMNVFGLSWRINSVMWSVQIELFVIPLLPLGLLAIQRFVPRQTLIVLIGLCIAGALLLNHDDARPVAYLYCFYIGMLIPLVSAQLLTYVLCSPTAATFLRHPWLVLMGDVSYSLYAFGQIILIFIAFTMFTVLPANSWTDHPMAFAVCLIGLNIVLALLIAAASYRWIELPGMALAKLILNRRAAPVTT